LKKILLTLAALALTNTAMALPFSDRVTLPSGEKIFVSGFNLAWINFGGDVGDVALNEAAYRSAMKAMADSGGNTMRVWLSTNGAKDPKFGADGLVSGLGTKTIANVQKMLAIAKENKMLLLPVLLTHNFLDKNAEESGGSFVNNKKLLTTDAGIKAYIDNALVPLVKAIGSDPNLLAWEICNECEGMVEGIGWTTQRITKADVQKITNRMAGAIKRAVPGVLVSTGTVQANYLNWYADAALKTAGADADGTMDFYMVHYYGWNGSANSPFKKAANGWSLDKPIVVGEFASSDWSPSVKSSMQDAEKIDTLMENLYKNGYAGGLFWQYQQDGGDPWMKGFATAGTVTAKFARAHKDDVTFDGISDGKFSVVASATAGGTITVDPTGRVAAGSVVTLVATPAVGYNFVGWSGDTASTATTLKVTVNKDRNLQAVFTPGAGTNLVKGGAFANATETASWELGNYPTPANASTVSYTSGAAAITVTATDTTDYGVQIRQGGIQIDSAVTYVLSFDAFATKDRDITPTLTTGDWKWQSNATVSITATKATYSVDLKSNINSADGMIQFCVGKILSTVTIDNVTLVRKTGTSILPRTIGSSKLSLRSVSGGFEWVRSAPLAGAATVRVVDVQGHELYRSVAKAGAVTGFVPAVGAGLRFVVLEGAAERDVRSLTSTR
jgi:hypothetical protein